MEPKIRIGGIEILSPREIVYDILRYKTTGTVLDLGAGFGRHSLFLASHGFIVTAVEKETEKLEKLKQQAGDLPADITTVCADVIDFASDMKFDVVIATMVLHFLPEQQAKAMIKKMKEYTTTGGLNVITVYTDANPGNLRLYQFKKQELRALYHGWNILQYEESLGGLIDNPKDCGPSQRCVARMIARKLN